MNDPRGVLEEFVHACDGFRDARAPHYDSTISANLDPESRRMAYRDKHEQTDRCRYCPRPADTRTLAPRPSRRRPNPPRRKVIMCTQHLNYYRDKARERARRHAEPGNGSEGESK